MLADDLDVGVEAADQRVDAEVERVARAHHHPAQVTQLLGDRLVVGQVSGSFDDFRDTLDKLAAPAQLNQQYQSQVEVATGSFASVYVPTAQEKQGAFSTFAGLLVDPKTNMPFPDGNISDYANRDGLWAFRVSSQALITTLGLATPLSYSYDRGSITIYGNVADATHGQSTGEVLGNGDATKAWLSFALSQSPLTYVSAPTAAGAGSAARPACPPKEQQRNPGPPR